MTPKNVTGLLAAWRQGEPGAFDELMLLIYDDLRRLARRHMAGERRGHTLQTTALVNEACLRLLESDVDWQDRVHFYAVASRAMRRILVDHVRSRRSAKRGGGNEPLPLEDAMATAVERPWDLLDVHQALERLEKQDARKAQVVELHYFGGLKIAEIALVLDITQDAAAWDMRMAKAWLRRELRGASAG